MKKQVRTMFLSLMLIMILSISLIPIYPNNYSYAAENTTEFNGGDGTMANPYKVSTPTQLDNVRNHLSSCFIMTNDLNFTEEDFQTNGQFYNNGYAWNPIGDNPTPFTGEFDGNNHTITGLKAIPHYVTGHMLGGVFGHNSGSIKNLAVTGFDFSGTDAWANYWAVGGIAGINRGAVINCTSKIKIDFVGITNSIMYLGGVVGLNSGSVSGSKSMSTINANTGEDSYLYAGGVVGDNSGTITSSFSLGDIVLSATKAQEGWTLLSAGGVAGSNIGTVRDCYNTGKVSASYPFDKYKLAYAGGIVGNLDTLNSALTCTYNTGVITASGKAGSILGNRVTGSIHYCYYLAGTAGSAYGTSLTATQMQTQGSYAGFDFLNTWAMNSISKLPTLQSNPPQYIFSISFDQSSINIAKGGLKTLNINCLPSYAEKKLTYKSSNTAIATVSTTGTVTGVSLGSTNITVTDGYTGKNAVCKVYIIQGIDTLKVNGVGTVDVGLTTQLTTAITPTTPYDSTIFWRSSDEAVATVSGSGLVTGIKAGTATIYATAKLGTPATQNVAHQIQVVQHPESVVLDYNNLTLAVGENQTLTPTILPADTTNKKLIWSSSNESVATVSPDGLVTAVFRGDATITAKTVDGGMEAVCAVNSIQKVEAVWIDYDGLPVAEYTLQNRSSIQLSEDVQPDNANNQGVTWYTSDPAIVTVDGTGLVTANAEGTAVVTIVSDDGNKVDTCVIYVGNQQTGTLSINSESLKDGDPIDYTQTEQTVPPLSLSMAADKVSKGFALVDSEPISLSKPQWSSANPSVATVDKYGYIHGSGVGTITITAYATDCGRVTSSKEVTIIRDFAIKYNLNGGVNPTGTQGYYTYATGFKLPAPTRTGYAFAGWYQTSSFSGSPLTVISTTAKGDLTLYAKWIPNTYTIRFNRNYGTTGTMASMSMTYNVSKALPTNAFKKTGYTFLGWATSPSGSVVYKDKASVKNLTTINKATVNLYAKWGAPILAATSYNYTSIKVSWAYAGSATSYRIYRATSAGGSYSLVYVAASTARSWLDTGQTTGKTYYYKVSVVAGGKTYHHSTYKYAKAVPAAPTVTLSKASATSIKVSWTGVSGATKYQIFRASSATGTYTYLYTASSTARSWVNTGRTPGKYYYYKVRAYHLEGTTKVYGISSAVKYLKI